MNWHANATALNLWNDGIFSESEKDSIISLWKQGREYDSPAAVKVRELLIEKGYDGIAYKNEYEGEGYSFIAFQIIKYEEDKKDIKFNLPEHTKKNVQLSLKERNAEYLSAVERGDMETAQRMVDEAAKTAMKESKVRGEDGKLLKVYHGSPSKFNVFEHKYLNSHGNAHGRGFYFTENKSMAEGYSNENGQLLQGYLNITKPLSEEKKTIKKTDLAKLIKATCEEQAKAMVDDGEYDSLSDALLDTWVSNYVMTYGMRMQDVYIEVADTIFTVMITMLTLLLK